MFPERYFPRDYFCARFFPGAESAGGALAAGTLTASLRFAAAVALTESTITGGTPPYSTQFYQAPDVSGSPGAYAGTGSPVAGSSPAMTVSSGVVASSPYWFYAATTDSVGDTATSNALRVAPAIKALAAGELGKQRRDTTATYLIGPVTDAAGNSPGTFDGSEAVAANLWNVTGGAAVALPAPAWISPTSAAVLALTVPASVVSLLAAEEWNLEVTVTQGGVPLDAFTGKLTLLGSPFPTYSPTAAVTRARLEQILLRRCSALMKLAKMDWSTQDGTNLDLDDPLSRAARYIGLPLTDPTHLQDADLANFPAGNLDLLLAAAELQLRLDITGRFIGIDVSNPQFAAHWEQFDQSNRASICDLRRRLAGMAGIAVGPLLYGDPYHPPCPQNPPLSHTPPPPMPLYRGVYGAWPRNQFPW